jgi:hypothetical protein
MLCHNIFTVMDTSVNLANKWYGAYLKYSLCSDEFHSPATPSTGDKKAACKDGNIIVTDTEPMFPLPPFRQTPGPIARPSSYPLTSKLAKNHCRPLGCRIEVL